MNHFSIESTGKEKIKSLMKEGMESQAFHRSRTPAHGLFHRLPGFMLWLTILGILVLLVR